MGWRALRFGVLAGTEHREMLQCLGQTCQTVVDIGANRGQFAAAVHSVIPQAQIFSFEPLKSATEKFKKVFADATNIQLHEVAIGAVSGRADFHVSKCADSSSLLPIGKRLEHVFPGTGESHLESVEVRNLTDVLSSRDIKRPALLKLDVQGYELEALRGCLGLLPCFDFVYAECSFVEFYTGQALASEIIDFLSNQGLCLSGIFNLLCDRNGRPLQGDFLFQRAAAYTGRIPIDSGSAQSREPQSRVHEAVGSSLN